MRRACDNPFAVHRVMRQRYRMSENEWAALDRRFEAMGRRGAIIGPHGCGKTTLLEDFAARLEGAGRKVHWFRFDDLARRLGALPRFGPRDVVACDGAEQLSWIDWARLKHASKRAGGLIITTHRASRLLTLHDCRPNLDVVRRVVSELDPNVPVAHVDWLHSKHAGNAREVIRALYDAWSEADESPAAFAARV
jgi:hypothetical protein